MTFRESEGLSMITTNDQAKAVGISDYVFECRMITCQVHSSLDAVGFMAAIARALAEIGKLHELAA